MDHHAVPGHGAPHEVRCLRIALLDFLLQLRRHPHRLLVALQQCERLLLPLTVALRFEIGPRVKKSRGKENEECHGAAESGQATVAEVPPRNHLAPKPQAQNRLVRKRSKGSGDGRQEHALRRQELQAVRCQQSLIAAIIRCKSNHAAQGDAL